MDKRLKCLSVPKLLSVGPDVLQLIFRFSTSTGQDYITQALVCKEFRANLKKETLGPCMQFNLDRIKPEDYMRELYMNIISNRLIPLRDFTSTRVVTLINTGKNIIWRNGYLPPATQKLVLAGLSFTRPVTLPTSITELVLISCRLSSQSFARLNLPKLRILRVEGYAPRREDRQVIDGLVARCPDLDEVWISGVCNAIYKHCAHPNCHAVPSFGPIGGSRVSAKFCEPHADMLYFEDVVSKRGMVSKRCVVPCCNIMPSFGYIGANRPTHCAMHRDRSTMESLR